MRDLGREMLAGLTWIFRCLLCIWNQACCWQRLCSCGRWRTALCLEDFPTFVHPKRPGFYATQQETFSFCSLGLDPRGGRLADGSEEIDGRNVFLLGCFCAQCSLGVSNMGENKIPLQSLGQKI